MTSAARGVPSPKGAKKLHAGDRIDFSEDFHAAVAAKNEEGDVTLAFDREGASFYAALVRHGHVPLPPYIKRPRTMPRDRGDYQTIFAAKDGAVAAPTAGLHFTRSFAGCAGRRPGSGGSP